ncbi:Solute carrier family 40 protein [Aphelenchoides besseyi]|nr:Solute carrier family 40 protein [Aphelenchoides besseyi]KAI6231730.1 Solute carrier family 40 protein [Aphelenchoides besseyi]
MDGYSDDDLLLSRGPFSFDSSTKRRANHRDFPFEITSAWKFARVKLRRRVVAGGEQEEDLEPVEYADSDSDTSIRSQRKRQNAQTFGLQETWLTITDGLLQMAEKSSGISRAFLLLYSGYCISCIGDRLWTFAIVFILERLGGMRLVCINQLIEGISAMLLSTYVGNWLDRHDRRYGTLSVLAVNNISVAISAAMLYFCLTLMNAHGAVYIACISFSIIFCALSKCASEGEKLSFTKDWIVVLAKREGTETLSKRNAIMTVIDQTSSVIAPIITSYSLTFLGYRGACVFFVACNLAFWVVERGLLAKVYNDVAELHVREKVNDYDPGLREEIDLLTQRGKLSWWKRLSKMLHAYWRQSVFSAAFGLSLLYMTVLGFDGLAISYGKETGLPDDVIGWFRSAGSALGIAGAATYTTAERIFGVRRAGFTGLLLQQVFLYLCVMSIFLPGSPFDPEGYARETHSEPWWSRFRSAFADGGSNGVNDTIASGIHAVDHAVSSNKMDWSTFTINGHSAMSIMVFFTGLTLARLGLWMADLSITQIMQERVPEEERGTVFGVQNAFCQFFSVLKDLIVLAFPDPRLFGFLIIMSVTFVTFGFLHYIYYLFKTRNPRSITNKQNGHHSSLLNDHKLKASQELRPLTKPETATHN